MPTMRATRASERGIVLWMTIFIVLVLGGLSAAFLYEAMGEKTAVEHRRTSLLALQICEAGTIRSQMEITSLVDSGTDGVGNVSGQFAGGTFSTQAVQNPTLPDRWTLVSTGTYRLSRKRIEVGIRRREHSDWVEGLFARDALRANGNITTDSYDSRSGPYASQAVNTDKEGNYALTNGHLGSNAGIRLLGTSVTVRGNAIPGPSSTVTTSGSPDIWGDILPRRSEVPVPDVPQSEFEAALAANTNTNMTWTGVNGSAGSGGKSPYDTRTYSLVASGSRVVTLTGGTYVFSEVNFSGGAQLIVAGPSVIYVTGRFDLGGGSVVNSTGIPSDLVVYAHPYTLTGLPAPTHSEVIFNGGPEADLAIYAPGVDVTMGGDDDVFGAVVGRTITTTGNPYFHYDEALAAWNKHSTVYLERLYWRDLTTHLR